MESLETLAARAGISIERRSGAQLVRVQDAPALLDEIGRAGLSVLGAEAFRLRGVELVPDLDAILDLSGLNEPTQSVEQARSFVDALSQPDLLLEFVLAAEATGP